MPFELGAWYSRQLDSADELAAFRSEFLISEPDLIYLDGNSLGRLPRRTVDRLHRAIEVEWGREMIRSWNAGWWDAPTRIGEKLAGLLGAGPGQVIGGDSTSANLFKLVLVALGLRPGRRVIVTDTLNFPSDLYVLQGCLRLLGGRHELRLVSPRDGLSVDPQDLADAVDPDTALVTLSHVAFKSGFLYDMKAVTDLAHRNGALVLWDLSHSAGAVPIDLDGSGADLAVGCTYKYLNGGPGAPAYLYVRSEHQQAAVSPIWGWYGQQSPFAFGLQYEPAEGMKRFLVGSPPILSMLALEPALDLVAEAGLLRIRAKSSQLTAYLMFLFDELLAPLGFTLGTPRDPERRGSHVSLRHPEGYRITQAVICQMNVLPDFREPDNIRLGLSPLYTTFSEVWEAVERVRRVVEEGLFELYCADRPMVT